MHDKYPDDILNQAADLCDRVRDREISKDGFTKLLHKSFPHLTQEQLADLYDWGMRATQ